MNNSKIVVIAEDDKDALEMLAGILAKKGYATRTAENGAAALAILKQMCETHESCFAVVSDNDMESRMNGIELLVWVKENLPQALRIFMSGNMPKEDVIAPAAPHTCLNKPFGFAELLNALDQTKA